jgi:tetratricopeptide (TPR) repeat protein
MYLLDLRILHARYYLLVLNEINDSRTKIGDSVYYDIEKIDNEFLQIESAFNWLASSDKKYDEEVLFAEYVVNMSSINQFRYSDPKIVFLNLKKARDIFHRIGDVEMEGKALNNLGFLFGNSGEDGVENVYLEEALDLLKDTEYRYELSRCLHYLGLSHYYRGEYAKSIEYQERCIQISEVDNRKDIISAAIGNIAECYWRIGKHDESIALFEKVLIIDDEIGDISGKSIHLGNLGAVYISIGNVDKAIELHEEHLRLAKILKDSYSESHALGNLGICYGMQGDLLKSIDMFNKSLNISLILNEKYGQAQAYMNIGYAYSLMSDYENAMINYDKSHELNISIGNKSGVISVLGNKIKVHCEMKKTNEAISLYEECMAIAFEANEVPEILEHTKEIVDYLSRNGMIEKGIQIIENCLKYFHDIDYTNTNDLKEYLNMLKNGETL